MNWPKQSDVLHYHSVYGDPRGPNGLVSPGWAARNLTYIKPPFALHMAEIPITRIRIHKACQASLDAILMNIWEAAGKDQQVIDHWGMSAYGGSFNYRFMRGLSVLSMHSFGCAIDLDPARNGLGSEHGHFDNVPQVLKAFADQGWEWGGNWHSRKDKMHFQAAITT